MLGATRVSRGGVDLPLGGPRQRLVLALLLVEPGRSHTAHALLEGVWGAHPPATARKTLQGYVHHLRKAVGDAIVTDGVGYRLEVQPAQVDAARFESLAGTGRAHLPDRPAEAAEILSSALALWTGRPFEDLYDAAALAPEIRRLEDMRLEVLTDRIAAELAVDVTPDLLGELQALAIEFPLRERLHMLLMLALHRAGRSSDALQAHDRLRRQLAVELGADPAPQVQELHARILRHDPTLLAGSAPMASGAGAARERRGVTGYELHEVVGKGPLGTVHRAYQTGLGRSVALKVLHADIADDPALVAAFSSDVARSAALDHRNIVPVLDAWREPGMACVVRPWLRGGSLADIAADGPVGPDRLVSIVGDVAAGLGHAHARGVTHGRLKPTNVLVDEGHVGIVDFHIDGADPLGAEPDREWMAPEVAGGDAPSPAADVYGLAALAVILATGATRERQPATAVPGRRSIERLGPGGQALATALAPALHPDPARRPADVDDVLAAVVDVVVPTGAPGPASAAPQHARDGVPAPLRNPFKGLRAFDEADSEDFFGRSRLIDRVVERMANRPLVALVGPSGSGKSSVVRAGVVPRLRRDHDIEGPPLLVATCVPGADPFAELAASLVRVAVRRPVDIVDQLTGDPGGLVEVARHILPRSDAHVVVVIDQFEELFTLVDDVEVRRRFLATLQATVEDPAARIRILLTLRADFYDQPLQYHDFGRLVEAGAVTVTPPGPDELVEVVTAPARAVGLTVEPALVSRVVRDVMDQPGGLPLLQYTLTELVEHRRDDVLTVEAYGRAGGVMGALGGRAEHLWDELTPAGRDALRQALLRMVTVDDAGDDIRRRVRRAELATLPVAQADLSLALAAFGSHRLLSFDRDPVSRGPTVEVAHEALLREWPRLRGWIEARREELVLSRRLAIDLQEWLSSDRDDSWLLRGERLDRVAAFAATTDLSMTAAERDFLAASRALRDRERRVEQRREQRLRRLLVVVSSLAVLAIAGGAVAWWQARLADDRAIAAATSRAAAETRRLALQAQQLVESDREVAVLLALEALRRDPGPDSLGALQTTLAATAGWLGNRSLATPTLDVAMLGDDVVALGSAAVDVFRGPGMVHDLAIPAAAATTMAVSAQGGLVAVADATGVWIAELGAGERVGTTIDTTGRVTSLAFDPAGQLVAVGQADGHVRVHDVVTGAVAHELVAHPEDTMAGIETPAHQPANARFGVQAVAFSADGTRLVTGGLVSARVWDLASAADLDEARLDDVRLTRVLGDGSRAPAPVDAVAFADATGDTILLASTYNVVAHRVGSGDLDLELERPFPDREHAQGGDRSLATVWLSPDVAVLAERGGGVTVMPLDGSPVVTLDAQATGAPRVAMSSDRHVVLFAGDHEASRWSMVGHGPISTRLPSHGRRDAQWSADGGLLVLNSVDSRPPVLWQVGDGPATPSVRATAIDPVTLPDGFVGHYAFPGPDPWLVAVDLQRRRLLLYRTDRLDRPEVVLAENPGDAVAFSPDGRYVAWHASDPDTPPTVSVYDLEQGLLVADRLDDLVRGDNWAVPKLVFSPDAGLLVGTGTTGEAVVWDTRTWAATWLSQGGGSVLSAGFTPDGTQLVTMSQSGRVVTRHAHTLQPDGPPLLGQTDGMDTLNMGPYFSPEGRVMVTTADGSGRLWDLEARTLVGEPFSSDRDSQPNASHDASRLATFDGDDVIVWDLRVDQWPDLACNAAGRNLTRGEWDQFGPRDTDYRPTCDQWPPDEPQEEPSDE